MRKRVLLVIPRFPYPLIGGDRIKNHNLIKILNKHYDLDVVTISYENYFAETERFLAENTTSYRIFKYPIWKFYRNTLRALINFKPLQVNFFYFPEVKRYIDERAKDVDLIIACWVRTAEYVHDKNLPKILDMADSYAFNYKNSYKKATSLFWKMIYLVELPLLYRYEKKMLQIFDRALLFNKREIAFLNSPKALWIPHGVNDALLNYETVDLRYSKYISFFGKMDYRSNVEAVLWFVKNVFFHLPEDIKFQIIGAFPTKEILNLQKLSSRIEVRGYVDDPYVMLKSSLCNIAPMQIGGGIQNKILEAMAVGSLVVTSSFSAYPIAKQDDNVFIIADSPIEWINTIVDIYNNPQKYEQVRRNAREYIKQNFTWEIFEKYYINVIEEVFAERTKFEKQLEYKSV
mgnify:CR=1 FL=1